MYINEFKKYSSVLILSLISLAFIMSICFEAANAMIIFVLILFFYILFVSYKKSGTEILIGFLITFFVYLLGRCFVLLLKGEKWYGTFSINTAKCIAICLFLSLLFVYLGFLCSNKNSTKIKKNIFVENYTNGCKSVKKISKYLFYLTIAFAIVENLEVAIYVLRNSYVSYYTSFVSVLPTIVTKIAKASDFVFFIFLATLPTKKELKFPVFLFLFSSIITLFSGSRGGIVNTILFIYLYYSFRSHIEKNSKVVWISKMNKVILVLCIPFFVVFLSVYNTLRNGNFTYSGFFDEILTFFIDQGGSANIIGYTEMYKDSLPSTNVSYLFGPIISLFKYGTIGRLFTGLTEIKNNTVEMALYGNNLGATISYLVMPSGWTSGLGLGTEYIAEAYADLGYFGVVAFNFLLGILIRKSNFISHNSWIINALFINIIMFILRMPRNNALSFVPELVSLLNWAIIILVVILSKYSFRKNRMVSCEL